MTQVEPEVSVEPPGWVAKIAVALYVLACVLPASLLIFVLGELGADHLVAGSAGVIIIMATLRFTYAPADRAWWAIGVWNARRLRAKFPPRP